MKEVDFAFYSDVGGRADNEDSYLAKKLEDAYLFVVADGLGGHDDGEMASRMAADAVKEYLQCKDDKDILKAVEFANNIVFTRRNQISSEMKTTIAAVYIGNDETVIAHVGDTRVYAFHKGKIVFRTIDHSASQLAVSVGEIKECDIRSHADRNVLTRAIGAGEKVKADVTILSNAQYDAILLCSDGFWEYVLESEMEESMTGIRSADKWLYKMRSVQLRKAPEKCDNNTAIAVMI